MSTSPASLSTLVRQCASRLVAACALAILFVIAAPAQEFDFARAGPVAREQFGALAREKASRTHAQRKIDSRLLLTIDAARPSPRFPELHGLHRPAPERDGLITVDIDLFDGARIESVLATLKQVRAEVGYTSQRFHAIRARLRAADIETIAELPPVRLVEARREFETYKNATNEGDVAHKAYLARANLGYTGNGQKLCALSNGVNSLAARQTSGDLPAVVDVLPGHAGSGDEGTAMLEILHFLAPGARLGFAAAASQPEFAQNVLDLADPAQGGCTILVDDIGFFNASPFQESIATQAVNAVTAAGALYFSSAGNSRGFDAGSPSIWEGDFNSASNLTNALLPGHVLHEFVPGVGANPALTQSPRADLYWAEPDGAAANDYDLYVLDATLSTVLASSTNTQDGTQNAHETVVAGTTFPAGSRVVVAKQAGAGNRMLSVQWYRAKLTYGTPGAARGHATAADAFSIAATPAAAPAESSPPGPYPSAFNAGNKVELFSSDGPRRIFFDGAGNLLPGAPPGDFSQTGGIVRNKPDFTAADGVSTATPAYNPFYGTSAAAPVAAAIAALVREAFPAWTTAQMRAALAASVVDIHGLGWDRNSGAGIVMPLETLTAAGVPAIPALVMQSAVAAEVGGNGNGQVDGGEDWKFDITLANTAGAFASGVRATLTSNTPGVVVTSGTIQYGNIAVGASLANPAGSPFRFSVFANPCGRTLDFTLSVLTTQSAVPHVYDIRLPTLLVTGAPQTFSYTGPAVAIPDAAPDGSAGAAAVATLPVSGMPGTVGSVQLRINGQNACIPNSVANAGIDHTFVGDLTIELKDPGGTTVAAINRMGRGGNAGVNFCNTLLDDASAGTLIGAALETAAPFTGSYKPDAPLAAFLGGAIDGNWSLRATDRGPGDTGHINRYSLLIAPQACTPVARTVALTATRTVAGAFYPGGTVVYAVTLTNTGDGTQADNPGDEYLDVLPGALSIVPASTSASAGSLSLAGNTVHWNGAIHPGASVTLHIVATVNAGTVGQVVSSQGTAYYDANHDGSNESTLLTDDPAQPGPANPAVFTVLAPTLDADANDQYDALTDGLLILRYMLGQTGNALVAGALGPFANRPGSAQIRQYLDDIRTHLDVDGNNAVDPLTDGLLVLRYLFGFRGAALIEGAVAPGAPRQSPEAIWSHLQPLMP